MPLRLLREKSLHLEVLSVLELQLIVEVLLVV